jgi:hypothetical protein
MRRDEGLAGGRRRRGQCGVQTLTRVGTARDLLDWSQQSGGRRGGLDALLEPELGVRLVIERGDLVEAC